MDLKCRIWVALLCSSADPGSIWAQTRRQRASKEDGAAPDIRWVGKHAWKSLYIVFDGLESLTFLVVISCIQVFLSTNPLWLFCKWKIYAFILVQTFLISQGPLPFHTLGPAPTSVLYPPVWALGMDSPKKFFTCDFILFSHQLIFSISRPYNNMIL